MQALPFVQGDAEFNDWLADIIGLGLMLAILWGARQVVVAFKPLLKRKRPPGS